MYAVAHLLEEGSTGQVGDVVGDLKVTVRTRALGVDDALRDALSVKVREQVDVVEVCRGIAPSISQRNKQKTPNVPWRRRGPLLPSLPAA
jgi:hypothetical protein